MKKILLLLFLVLLVSGFLFADTSQEAVVTVNISNYADARRSDSQDPTISVNDPDYEESGHGDPNAPVQVEGFYTTAPDSLKKFNGEDWYQVGSYAFGWYKNGGWHYNSLNPEDIATGVYDSGGDNPTSRDSEQNYLFIGNHTRLTIATNFNPIVKVSVPDYLSNGTSQIKIKRVQIEWNDIRLALIQGNATGQIGQCTPGNYSANGYGIYVLIEIPEAWWTITPGEYTADLVFTIEPPSTGG